MAGPNDALVQELLHGRYVACLGTQNDDGSIYLNAVWYLFDEGNLFVATSSRSRKARNLRARPKASLMIDIRQPAAERGVAVSGSAQIVEGEEARRQNRRIYQRYLSPAALADPRIVPVFESLDDVTIRMAPEAWASWDLREVDKKFFGGALGANPGYILPCD